MATNNQPGQTMANNQPVGAAGQPFQNLKKEVPEAKKSAIARRMKKHKKQSGGFPPKANSGGN